MAEPVTYGSYTVERELGRGGMGAVYAGVHQVLGRRAAIKVLLPQLSRDADLVARFLNEARAATAIKHPSIVEIYDVGVAEDGSAFIVMELLDGESLATRLEARGVLSAASAVAIGRQIATALAVAHHAGIVHRDLKPDNVFLVPDPEVASGERAKLLDFGIAKLTVDGAVGTARTMTGALLGTPYYMSPEQCEGAREVDHRSDLYSLGCVLFEMITGRVPFEANGVGAIIGMHLHVEPPTLRSLQPDAPAALEAIVARLLAKAPDARYQTADEVAQALGALSELLGAPSWGGQVPRPASGARAAIATSPTVATMAPGAPPSLVSGATVVPDDAPPRRRAPWVVGGVLLVAATAAGAYALLRGPTAPRVAMSGSGSGSGLGSGAVVVAVPGDAAIAATTDVSELITAARHALDEKRYDAAITLAGEVQRAHPGDPDAVELARAAKAGKMLQGQLDGMRAAIARGDFDHLASAYTELYGVTVPGDPARADADALWTAAKPKAIVAAQHAVEGSVARGACAEARDHGALAIKTWGVDPRWVAAAVARCKPVVAGAGSGAGSGSASGSGAGSASGTGPVTEPEEGEGPPNADHESPAPQIIGAVAALGKALKAQDYPTAWQSCLVLKRAPKRQRHAGCVIAACGIHDLKAARRLFAQIPAGEAAGATQKCKALGIDLARR